MEDHGQYTPTRRRKLDNKSVQYPLVVLESNTWAIYTQYTHDRRRKLDNKSVQYPLVVLESNTSALKSDKECSGPEEQLNEVDVMGIHKKGYTRNSV